MSDYDRESQEFQEFREKVLDSNLVDMLGLFNWVNSVVEESQARWAEAFFKVEVADPDYVQAGGDRMNQFNIINTIKNTCVDFNIPYKEALQMPYGMTQVNSLAKATQGHIQHLMTKSIERRMKMQRENS